MQVSYGHVTFQAALAPSRPHPARAAPQPVVLPKIQEGARVSWGSGTVCFRVTDAMATLGAVFDHERIVWPLTLRIWRDGDRLRPRKGQGSRKLQDMFVDAKVPRGMRRLLPVLVDADDTVLFVPHLRPAEAASPTDQTKKFLVIQPENFVISPSSLATAPR